MLQCIWDTSKEFERNIHVVCEKKIDMIEVNITRLKSHLLDTRLVHFAVDSLLYESSHWLQKKPKSFSIEYLLRELKVP